MSKKSGPKNNANHFFNQTFDASKFKKVKQIKGGRLGQARRTVPYADGSDALANIKKLYISFLHVPTNNSVFFKAFITSFNETYTSNWRSEPVFGRADPLHSFVQTGRNINLSIMVPAASESEAFENLGRVQKLIQFLYPNYESIQQAQTISQGPLVRLKVMNLLQNMNNAADLANSQRNKAPDQFYKAYKSLGTDPNLGQLGFISSLTVNHNLENRDAGVFEKVDLKDTQEELSDTSFLEAPNQGAAAAVNTILPKNIELVISFTPIHEHPLGWNNAGRFSQRSTSDKDTESASGELFPYGIVTSDPTVDAENAQKTYGEAQDEANEALRTQQQKDNAEARYGGAFGKGRFKRDIKRSERAQRKANRAREGSNRAKYQQAKSDYFRDQAGGGQIQGFGDDSTVTDVANLYND